MPKKLPAGRRGKSAPGGGKSQKPRRARRAEDEDAGSDDFDLEPKAVIENDEDIDSDEAFDAEDEAKYGDIFETLKARGHKSGKGKGKGARKEEEDEIDLREGDEDAAAEDDEDDDDEYMDLSEMLAKGAAAADMKPVAELDGEEDDEGGVARKLKKGKRAAADDDIDEPHVRLLKALTASAAAGQARKKTVVFDAGPEAEFGVGSGAVSVDALVAALPAGAAASVPKALLKDNLTLEAPVSKRVEQMTTRAVAYQQSKEAVEKWVPIVKANREAEHLSFPLKRETMKQENTTAALQDKFQPTTSLEKEVAAILETSGAVERRGQALTTGEELEIGALSKEDARQRTSDLARLRALESYYAARCRRINAIKSKSFHRIKNKSLKRAEEKRAAIEGLQHEDPEAAASMTARHERERAQARISLRYKNQSKWVKNMISSKHGDDSAKAGLALQQQMGQELMKKITMESESDGSESDGSLPDTDDEQGMSKTILRLKADLEKPVEAEETAQTGLMALKFMQRAVERKRQEAKEALEQLERELETGRPADLGGAATGRMKFGQKTKAPAPKRKAAGDGDEDREDAEHSGDEHAGEGDGDDEPVIEVQGGNVTRTSGAVKVSKAARKGNAKDVKEAKKSIAKESAAEDEGAPLGDLDAGETNGGEEDADDWGVGTDITTAVDDDAHKPALAASSNPWLAAVRSSAGLTPELAINAFTKKADKRLAKMQRSRMAAPDASVAVPEGPASSAAGQAVASKPASGKASTASKAKKGEAVAVLAGDVAGTVASAGAAAPAVGIAKTDDQKALVKEAFAGDNVVEEEFEAQKAALVDKETVKDKDVTLPGWGAWGGQGTDPSKQKRVIQKAPPTAPRKDSGLKHVILNERIDKKNLSVRPSQVPFPYTSAGQYERAIRAPVGAEWNTFSTFKDMTRPAVSVQAGAVIAPMRISKSILKAQAEQEKKRTVRRK